MIQDRLEFSESRGLSFRFLVGILVLRGFTIGMSEMDHTDRNCVRERRHDRLQRTYPFVLFGKELSPHKYIHVLGTGLYDDNVVFLVAMITNPGLRG